MGQLGDLSPRGSVVVGVFVGLLSTSVQSLGLTLQRKSHILEDEKEHQDARRPPYRRRRWQLGMFMFIVSNIVGSTIQITTLPLPVLSTLQASGLVFNSICASLILGEPFTRHSFTGTILVCGGAILIAIFGAISEPAHSLDQLLELLGRQQFMLWMVGQVILVVSIIFGVRILKLLNPYTINNPQMRLFRGMAYGCISGILSAHSLLVAKSAVELLVRTVVDRKNQFNRWQSWMILLGLIALALLQLYYLHRGLKLCSTSILYPFVFCVYNIIAILDGLIYFRQTSRLSLLSASLIALGTVILLSGVLALSWRLNSDTTINPKEAQTPFAPGMGLAPETDSDDELTFVTSNEESRLLSICSPSSPNQYIRRNGDDDDINSDPIIAPALAIYGTTRRTVHYSLSPEVPTSSIKTKDCLSPAHLRRKGFAEADEIWGELEEAPSPVVSPFIQRRSSLRGTPVRHASAGFDTEASGAEPPPDEATGLLARAGTGRSYRERRRKTTGNIEIPHVGSQEAVGGWWKMRWWKSEGSRKDRNDLGDGTV